MVALEIRVARHLEKKKQTTSEKKSNRVKKAKLLNNHEILNASSVVGHFRRIKLHQ